LTIASGGQSDAVIAIRSADVTDAPAILQCLAAAFAPYRAEYTTAAYEDTVLTPETVHVRLQQRHILVATVAGKVVGTIGATNAGGRGHIRGMAVLPEWHGRGVAGELLRAIEDWLRSCGCEQVTLNTTQPLETAMKFYEKNGYRRSGHTSDFFGMTLIEHMKNL
jgi:GNAT superfamily N-acetyltransferase